MEEEAQFLGSREEVLDGGERCWSCNDRTDLATFP